MIRLTFAFVVLNCWMVGAAQAQYQDPVTQKKQAIDSLLAGEHLVLLEGLPKTFYSKGFEVRAAALQKLIKASIDFYESQLPALKFEVPLYVLANKDWNEQLFAAPYGLPNYLPDNNLILIGADKNALAKLSGQPQTSASDSVVSGYDYVAVHELGHYFFITLNGVRTGQKWGDEFLADYFLVAFMKEREAEVVKQWEEEQSLDNAKLPTHRTLDDFEKLYDKVGPPNYDWYQKKFIRLGLQLYPQFKTSLITAILENYAPGGKKHDPLTLMKTIAPDTMNKWLEEMK